MEIQYQSGISKSEIAVMTETIKERFLRKDDLDRCRLKNNFQKCLQMKEESYVLTVASEIPEFVYRTRNACFLVIFFLTLHLAN